VKAFVVLGRNQESIQIPQEFVQIIDVFSTALHPRYTTRKLFKKLDEENNKFALETMINIRLLWHCVYPVN